MYNPEPKFPWLIVSLFVVAGVCLLLSAGIGAAH
jgi:hypothetical protein